MTVVSRVCRKLLSSPIFFRFLNNEKLYIETFIDRTAMNEFSIDGAQLFRTLVFGGIVQNGGRRRPSFLNEFSMTSLSPAIVECNRVKLLDLPRPQYESDLFHSTERGLRSSSEWRSGAAFLFSFQAKWRKSNIGPGTIGKQKLNKTLWQLTEVSGSSLNAKVCGFVCTNSFPCLLTAAIVWLGEQLNSM